MKRSFVWLAALAVGCPGVSLAQAPLFEIHGTEQDVEWFGAAVEILKDASGAPAYLAVGSPRYGQSTSLDSGKVTLNDLVAGTSISIFASVPGSILDYFGLSLRSAGFLGAGVEDLVVSLPGYAPTGVTPAAKFIRPTSLISPPFAFYAEINGALGSGFGGAQAAERDVDGDDGIPDVAIGAPGANAAYVYSGSGLAADFTAAFAAGSGILYLSPTAPSYALPPIPPPAGSVSFGSSLALLEDLTGDGGAEVAVADFQYDGGRGRVSVFSYTPPGTWTGIYDYVGDAPGDQIGVLRAVGDVDLDGFEDLAVGARFADHGSNADIGTVFVLSGQLIGQGASGSGADVLWRAFGDDAYVAGTSPLPGDTNFGIAVEEVGDLNGDGIPDVLAGASTEFAYGPDYAGAAWPTGFGFVEETGSVTLLSGLDGHVLKRWFGPELVNISSSFRGPRFGSSIASGDLDGDGLDDLAVGARQDDNGGFAEQGSVIAYPGAYTLGRTYSGSPPSTLIQGVLEGSGSTSIVEDGLVFDVSGALPGESGLFFVALSPSFTPPLLLGSGLFRIVDVVTLDASGNASYAVSLGALPPSHVGALQRLYAQFIYRDGMGGTMYTEALDIGFLP